MGEGMSKRLKVQLGGEAEMEERAFNNPYPDYSPHGAAASAASVAPSSPSDEEGKRCRSASPQRDDSLPFDSDGKISPSFNKRITTKIKDLLQQMEEGLKTADPHDCSAYTGWTGIALLYLQLYHVTKEQSHLQRSLDYVKRILRNLNGRRVTFLCGDAGPLAVGAVVYHKLKNDSESKECVTKLLQLQRIVIATDSDLPDELLYGRAGYLYALLYLNTEIGPETVPQSVIKEVVDVIIESGKNFSREERKTERCPLLYQWHRKQYVGAAHGVSGIYYMLMQPASNVDQEILTELVKPSIDYVRHKKFRSGNYPSSLSNETDRLVHWCHGAPGVIHMLMQAYKIFKEDKYLKDAMECSDVIWQRGLLRKGYGICHGTAGNGYSFLSLYHLTLDKKYLYRACKFAEWCLEYGAHGCRIPDRPYSLFEGGQAKILAKPGPGFALIQPSAFGSC
ncbi:lanC-like protein 2 isoform X2 [Varanus komodoensis]|uniref:LanC-like protein 2 n=1 Tax=Varanus komodoensis TaxID=61221 RepID=A0A8D2L3X8_VARKO|nr:lanC-like protein 2 isoform X2 [Varanus komodoensis]